MRVLDRLSNAALWVTAALGLATVTATIAMLALDVRPVIVRSGSMGRAYPVRSVALVQRVPVADIRTGDTLLIDRGPDTRVLHRVVSIEKRGSAMVATLKGDVNRVADPEPATLSGTVYKAGPGVPLLGAVVVALRGPIGGFVLAVLVLTPLLVVGRRLHGEPQTAF